MKNVIIFLLLIIASKANSQDTASVTMTDSGKGYTYKNVYAIMGTIQIMAPGSFNVGNLQLSNAKTDTTKWVTTIYMRVFTSKSDYKAGKPELFSTYLPTLFTDKFPTQADILARMRAGIK